jgi:hypothetical protein
VSPATLERALRAVAVGTAEVGVDVAVWEHGQGAWMVFGSHPRWSRAVVGPLLEGLNAPTEGYYILAWEGVLDVRRSTGERGVAHDPSNGAWVRGSYVSHHAIGVLLCEAGLTGPLRERTRLRLPCAPGFDPWESEDLDAALATSRRSPPSIELLAPARLASAFLEGLVAAARLAWVEGADPAPLVAALAELLDRSRHRIAETEILSLLTHAASVASVKANRTMVREILQETATELRGTAPSSTTGWV